MIGSIVAGTDGTQTAARAIAVAADLARSLGAKLHLVNGYRLPGDGVPAGTDDPTAAVWRQASEAVLDEALRAPALAGLDVVTHSVPGGPAEALATVATEVRADLIVVGNRGLVGGRSGEGHDSVPETVARTAPCHVLIAKTT